MTIDVHDTELHTILKLNNYMWDTSAAYQRCRELALPGHL